MGIVSFALDLLCVAALKVSHGVVPCIDGNTTREGSKQMITQSPEGCRHCLHRFALAWCSSWDWPACSKASPTLGEARPGCYPFLGQ